jgi:hypothetical protein
LAYWVLALVDRRPHELKAFDIAPITPPRQERASNENENVVPLFSQPVLAIAHRRAASADGASADRASVDGASVGGAGQDAAQALSDALAALKQSLR